MTIWKMTPTGRRRRSLSILGFAEAKQTAGPDNKRSTIKKGGPKAAFSLSHDAANHTVAGNSFSGSACASTTS
jgi:hypothetical protein